MGCQIWASPISRSPIRPDEPSADSSTAVRAGHDDNRIVIKNFRIKVIFHDGPRHSIDNQLDVALTQFTIERCRLDVECHARVLLQQPIYDHLNQARRKRVRAPNTQLPCGRISEKSYLPNSLVQFTKHSDAALEGSAAILRWLNALSAAVEQPDAKSMLHVGNGLRNSGLRCAQHLCRFRHAP